MKARLVQAYRIAILLGLVWLLRAQHRWLEAQAGAPVVGLEEVRAIFPAAEGLGAVDPDTGGRFVTGKNGKQLGFVVQTSPESDFIVGYSGPTNVLVGFNRHDEVAGVTVLESGDTPDHLKKVITDEAFLGAYPGLPRGDLEEMTGVDGVSGATLTSLAIHEAIVYRVSGERPNLRFPDAISVEEAGRIFKGAERLEKFRDRPAAFRVRAGEAQAEPLGIVMRTAHLADEVKGYSGPIDVLIALDAAGETVEAVRIRKSYDTEIYVKDIYYDDLWFRKFEGNAVADLLQLELASGGLEGVSGATTTSLAMAEAILRTLAEYAGEAGAEEVRGVNFRGRDLGLIVVVLLGMVMAFTRLKANVVLRRAWQVALIVYVGFISGDLVAQALLLGWAQSGVAWAVSPGLVALAAAAFLLPVATGRQVYCHQICPHGALQQLLMSVLPKSWRRTVPARWGRWLDRLPMTCLFWVLLVGMLGWSFDLAGIEPFDAYIFRAAGWATLVVFGISVLFSLVVPMGYCRFGCPTGRLLEFVRFRRGMERFGGREIAGTVFLLMAIAVYLSRGWWAV